MTSLDSPARLLSEFPDSSKSEWRVAAEKLLKGAPFEKNLTTPTPEGILLQPIYDQDDLSGCDVLSDAFPGFGSLRRGSKPSGSPSRFWEVAQEIPSGTADEINRTIIEDQGRGQSVVHLVLSDETLLGHGAPNSGLPIDFRRGCTIKKADDLIGALHGIDLSKTPVILQTGASAVPFLAFISLVAEKNGAALTDLRGVIGADPLGLAIRAGFLPIPLPSLYDDMLAAALWVSEAMPGIRTVAISGDVYARGGASAVEELGSAIATGAEYMRQLLVRGCPADVAARTCWFTFALGTNFFMEIAKLRAARMLWSSVVEAFGGSPEARTMNIHTRSSSFTGTQYDPFVNMLRSTTEALAGAIGGCESLHVAPFDEGFAGPNEFSRRIARNTQLVLREEAHVGDVIDPAGGSWYVEYLTDAVAEAAWKLFQEIEAAGGMARALEQSIPQKRVAETATQRIGQVAVRKTTVLGVNKYPNLADTPPPQRSTVHSAGNRSGEEERSEREAHIFPSEAPGGRMEAALQMAASGATVDDLMSLTRAQSSLPFRIERIPQRRLAEEFESLRQAVGRFTNDRGKPPKAFLATMGPPSQHRARASFAQDFLSVGGFEVVVPVGFPTVEEAVVGATKSGAPVVVLCSTDETYPALVPLFAGALKNALPDAILIVAGNPGDHLFEYQRAGVDEFIHLRVNCLAVLHSILRRVGVPA